MESIFGWTNPARTLLWKSCQLGVMDGKGCDGEGGDKQDSLLIACHSHRTRTGNGYKVIPIHQGLSFIRFHFQLLEALFTSIQNTSTQCACMCTGNHTLTTHPSTTKPASGMNIRKSHWARWKTHKKILRLGSRTEKNRKPRSSASVNHPGENSHNYFYWWG